MNSKEPQPPKWADRFLSWYCNPKLLEQIQGDVHELFYWRLEEKGPRKAKRSFAWDVIRLFRWSNIKRKSNKTQKLNNIAMFKNYFKIGLRNLWKQRMPSLINGLGLALAIACCLVAYQFSIKDFIVDKFHENKDQIYLVTPVHLIEGTPRYYARTVSDINKLIPENVAGVESIVRYYPGFGGVSANDKEFWQTISFVDPEFFDEFTFPIKLGEKKPLKERGEVVLSESIAEKLFDREYPIGKTVNISIRGIKQDFIISAVMQDRGHETNMSVDIMINYSSMPFLQEMIGASTYTFLSIPNKESVQTVASGLDKLLTLLPEDKAAQYRSIEMVPFIRMMDFGEQLVGTFAWGINYEGILIIGAIALFMLTLATFNYINISTVMAMSRVKEIGVRKVVGSSRLHIVLQFLTENFILCLLSVLMGLALAKGLFLPWFNIVADEYFFFDFSNPRILIFIVSLLTFVTLASGVYPAYIAARMQPTVIFRNAGSKKSKRRLTGVLLTIQLALALITLVNALMFIYTEQHNKRSDWGFERSNRLALANVSNNNFDILRNGIEGISGVETISSSYGGITGLGRFTYVDVNNRSVLMRIAYAQADYAETMGLKLLKGRFLDDEIVEDQSRGIIVNETFLRRTGLDSINSKIAIDSTELVVVGVVKDYFYNGFMSPIAPTIIKIGNGEDYNHLTIKVADGKVAEIEAAVNKVLIDTETTEAVLMPMENILDDYFIDSTRTQNLMIFCASVAIFLAAMGIFGLVSLNIKHNIKRFGIKKVLGAERKHLYKDICKPFALISIIAFIIGGCASVILISPILEMAHSYYPEFNLALILSGILLLLLVMVSTVNTQVRKLVRLNPVDTLRNE
ncbi:ABC transporter permease [Roseivirga sp. E12]|uniref:ABC transporter permease n=1 Tax=Roseivirga sp. E12 TaxID=2819237 RepID=UPI001ABCE588|nr:ABC transporter permease [Roseivirga sp. E12]MBO3697809.1 ABC transporter permease [Roseivirga sp. E12]